MIAIIAVLAAMVSVAVVRALDTAKQTRIKLEIDQIDMAMKAYREKYGSYPPCDFVGGIGVPNSPLRAHIAQAFPRYANLSNVPQFNADLNAAGMDTMAYRFDQALVFWLKGFSPDPANPFVTPSDGMTMAGPHVAGAQIVNGAVVSPMVKVAVPLFDFDKTRLGFVRSPAATNTIIIPSYFPQGVKNDSTGAPYLYWAPNRYGDLPTAMTADGTIGRIVFNELNMMGQPRAGFINAGSAQPYALDQDGNATFDFTPVMENWVNPDSYQIISSGMDGKFGRQLPFQMAVRARVYPTGGASYDIAGSDDDNVTNFCPKARLGDAKP